MWPLRTPLLYILGWCRAQSDTRWSVFCMTCEKSLMLRKIRKRKRNGCHSAVLFVSINLYICTRVFSDNRSFFIADQCGLQLLTTGVLFAAKSFRYKLYTNDQLLWCVAQPSCTISTLVRILYLYTYRPGTGTVLNNQTKSSLIRRKDLFQRCIFELKSSIQCTNRQTFLFRCASSGLIISGLITSVRFCRLSNICHILLEFSQRSIATVLSRCVWLPIADHSLDMYV